ncbi:MAG: CrcB family protein [Cyanobacteria bacterium P01_H01_bin.74]
MGQYQSFSQVLSCSLSVALGGALGAMLRYGIACCFQSFYTTYFSALWAWFHPVPAAVATLAANLTGCLLIGWLLGALGGNQSLTVPFSTLSPQARLFIVTGFLGALTTFSSYILEAALLTKHGNWDKAVAYALGSLVLGSLILWMGYKLGKLTPL